jgi:tetratricopeptide (TPR) repeat protein
MEKPTRPCAACGKVVEAPRWCPCHREAYCGKECQKVLWQVHQLVCTWSRTEKVAEQVLQYGKDASQVGQAKITLGMTLEDGGHFPEAAESYEEASRIFANLQQDQNHAAALYYLGGIHRSQGHNGPALIVLEQALDIRRRGDGNHEEVADCLNSIGIALVSQGKYEEAAEKYEEALSIFTATHGPHHEKVTMMLYNMSNLYHETGSTEVALERLRQVLQNQRSQLGSDHKDVANTRMTIANLLRALGEFDEALGHLHEALPILRLAHGDRSPQAASALSLVGAIYKRQGNLDESITVQQQALRHFVKSLGEAHERTTSTRLFLADAHFSRAEVHSSTGDYQAALNQAELAQENLRSLPDKHEDLVHACSIMSCCREKLMNLAGALESATEVHRIFSELGAAHAEDAMFAAAVVKRLQTLSPCILLK